ncbi:MAG: hypothetical protein WKF78_10765 [Candidatus Limnocylindrales bacterium]
MALPPHQDGRTDDRDEVRHRRVQRVEYLRSTLFKPAFPDLWEIRARL